MKKRLDVLLVERGFCESREKAQALILAGVVWRGGVRLDKAGMSFPEDVELEVKDHTSRYVSRAGEKLEHALKLFHIDPAGKVAMDVGASTGGFTDCLLQHGAAHVYAIDVGHGQLDAKMRAHPKVTNLEKVNVRHITADQVSGPAPQIVTIDVSFISLRLIIPPLVKEFPSLQEWLILFKPQFEVGRKFIGKGGVVRDASATQEAMQDFAQFMTEQGLICRGGPQSSPLPGKKSGNVEYLFCYGRSSI